MKQLYRLLKPLPASKGLVCSIPLWYGFMSGVLLWDESQNGFEGTATNSPVPKYPAFEFTAASNQYIDIGTGPTVVKTIALWVKQDDIAGNEFPIDLNGTDYISVESGVVTVNGLAGHTLYVDGVQGTSGVTTIDTGWHHIAVTDSTENDASDFDIGRVTAAYYDGLIAGVRLYDRVLSAAEVLSLYHLERWRYSV